jgi:hypothetical protein
MPIEPPASPPAPPSGAGAGDQPQTWLARNLRPERVLPFAFFAILVASLVIPFSFQRQKDIEILAAISGQSDNSVAVTGRVLYKGQALAGGTIIAVATTFKGNEYSAQSRTAGEKPPGDQQQPFDKVETTSAGPGSFELLIERKPSPTSYQPLQKVITSISLRASTGDNKISGTEQLVVNHGDGFQQVEFAMTAITPLAGLFIFGLFWAFRRPDHANDRRFQYYISIVCALALTMTMLAIITISLKNISARVGEMSGSKRNVVLSLGFAYVFKGTYVKDGEPEWLFSFTTRRPKEADAESEQNAPQSAPEQAHPDGGAPSADSLRVAGGPPAPPAPPGKRAAAGAPRADHGSDPARQPDDLAAPIKGLGAPLWVLLLSVLGAAVLTISMVVSWVREPLDDDDEKGLRQRLEGIVRHQFYILFAPIGSVFVFQTLVAGEAATQPLAVGLAAFGSGMALSRLLNVAVDAAMKFLPKPTDEEAAIEKRTD